MGLVALMGRQTRLVVRGGALHVEKDGAVVRCLQTHEVSEVQVYGQAELTASARDLLMREGIDVVFLTADGRYKGRLVAAESRQGARRLAQYRFTDDAPRRLRLAAALIAGKLANQRAVLVRRQQTLRDPALADALVRLRVLQGSVRAVSDLDALRGVEGAAGAAYFAAFAGALRNPGFAFDGRTRYPPRDPVNAALSYGYALLQARVESGVRAAGLDVHLGVLHESSRGSPALALDLMEELRPAVDSLVLSLINLRQLSPEDFRTPTAEELGERAELADDAVYLGDLGRNVLLRAWEARLYETADHPIRGDRWPLRDLIREQAWQLGRIFEGEAESWSPLVLRS